MAYRNLHFRSLASDIRTESYLGEDHLVIPCIALVGDEVVYGMNAEGPEFIPADELEMSTLGWGDRPVLYDHPPASTSSACEPRTLEAMSFGRTFFPRFEDKKLKLEAWCNKRRAKEIGQEELLASAERGDMIELSIGAIISLIRQNGVSPSGKQFGAYWTGIQSDHLAIGLSGSQGACNIKMGCGANRVLKAGSGSEEISDTRTMRANRGVDIMPEIRTATKSKPEASRAASPPLDIKPRTLTQRILSLASKAFRSNAEDEGLSDKDLRDKLWTALYAVEPAFYGIENVYQESMTVTYITSPDGKIHLWRRTFTVGDDGAVAINEDREEVAVSEFYYVYMGDNPTATIAAQVENDKPCGCQSVNADRSAAANETNTSTSEGDTNMPDDPNKPKTDATPPASTAPTTTTPAKPPASNTPATTTTPAATVPDETTANPDATATSATTEQLKALLEAHPVVKHYRAQEAKEKASLVAALTKKQTVLSKDQLDAKPIEELRTYAEFLGIGSIAQQSAPIGDFSGRMMADGGDNDPAEVKVPKSWSAALKVKSIDKGDKEAN